ncbi:MAG: M24 family metallopeptidase [Chlorobia bacterium]|nr:M24 family metallopeptidase [Fimbriimonadaceae bacterium]
MTGRLSRLAQTLQEQGVDAYLACTTISMGYLAGLFEDGHERLLLMAIRADGQMRLICPALTANQAQRIGIQDIRPWADGEDPRLHVDQLAQDWNLRSGIIAVDNQMRADILLALQDAWPAALFKAGEPVLSQLMRRKDGTEVELMQRAAQIADQAYRDVKPSIKAGLTEVEVGKMLADAMADLGGKPTFAIVAAGPNGAEPHHLNDETVLKAGDVVILDFGCDVQSYQSDITRVVAIESALPKASQVYEIVYRAHMAGRQSGMAGTKAGDVDAATRKVIDDAGYGIYFVHRTGHGIGMNGHEAPNITPGSDFMLEVGNCFSIEPGVYLPGEFGVRIENIVMAQSGNCLSLNEEPSPTLDIVG